MRYSAFISYNHRDKKHAIWLHRSLERYRFPKRLQSHLVRGELLGPKLKPVFRDRDELAASADLGAAVKQALADSETLIVICSPNSARSRWVNEEIKEFAALGRADRIRLLIVDGEPHAADPESECLPPALREIGLVEPLASDLRSGQDGRTGSKLKLIASMVDLPYDELRQREAARRQRQLAFVATAATVGLLIMTGLTVLAFVSRAEAVEQRDVARQRTLTAERTVQFVQSMFAVSDPSEARGATITAREVLDRGRQLIDRSLEDEPAVKAELGITLGEVYGSLGLFAESDELIRRTFRLQHGQKDVRVRQLAALGESQARLGNYERAIAAFQQGIAIARQAEGAAAEHLPRLLVRLGEAYSALDKPDAAEAVIKEALDRDLKRYGAVHSDVARDWEALGLAYYFAGELDKARQPIERALAIRLREEGEMSPSVADNLNTLASIALEQGDRRHAERLFRRNLAIDEKVLGAGHPDLAATLANLGRLLLERRAFAEAVPLFERAIAINLEQRSETHDDMTFLFSNLGLARRGQGRLREAEDSLLRGLRTAELHKHRTRGPIMSDLAEVRCAAGRQAEGLKMALDARPITAGDYPDDPWRVAWSDSIIGGCRLVGGDKAEAAKLIRASTPHIHRRWPPGTYFRTGHDRRLAMARGAGG